MTAGEVFMVLFGVMWAVYACYMNWPEKKRGKRR